MPFDIFRRKATPFARNRAFLRSPVMERLDELFADPAQNAAIYERALAERPKHLDPDYVLELFARHSPDESSRCGARAADVVEHVFSHILGEQSWWGRRGASWEGSRLFAEAFLDAFARAQARGNVPIKTFHQQSSSDGELQLNVLDAERVIVVIVSTPPVPDRTVGGIVIPAVKAPPRRPPEHWVPVDPNMPDVSNFTQETLPR